MGLIVTYSHDSGEEQLTVEEAEEAILSAILNDYANNRLGRVIHEDDELPVRVTVEIIRPAPIRGTRPAVRTGVL